MASTQSDYLKDLYPTGPAPGRRATLELDGLRDMFEEWHLATVEPTA